MGIEFMVPGKASFIIGGGWGSEGKGAAAAWLGLNTGQFDIVTSNAGSQSGHTSVHDGKKLVLFHMPTTPAVQANDAGIVYLNAGAIINPQVLEEELKWVDAHPVYRSWQLFVHPNAAIVTQHCIDAEGRDDSPQTAISSTRKGVGEALARKVLRSSPVAKDYYARNHFIRRIDLNLRMTADTSVLVEVPQGVGLSLNSKFYPHCTSRDSTIMQAMSDAHIHPSFLGKVALVLRTFPIRVGNIGDNSSGDCYPDQQEISWSDLGVEPEITTVTKRVRRVFTFSVQQLWDALTVTRPDIIHLTFCDYMRDAPHNLNNLIDTIGRAAKKVTNDPVTLVTHWGPTTDDAQITKVF